MATTREELEHFKAFLARCKSISGAAMGFAALLPAAGGALPELIPPWPRGVQFLAVSLTVIVVLFAFLFGRTSNSARLRAASITCLAAGVICLLAYTLLLSSYVVDLDKGLRQVTGFALTSEAEKAILFGTARSATARDLFAAFGYESGDRIWRLRGVTRWLIAVSFWATFALWSAAFALLIVRNVIQDRGAVAPAGAT